MRTEKGAVSGSLCGDRGLEEVLGERWRRKERNFAGGKVECC